MGSLIYMTNFQFLCLLLVHLVRLSYSLRDFFQAFKQINRPIVGLKNAYSLSVPSQIQNVYHIVWMVFGSYKLCLENLLIPLKLWKAFDLSPNIHKHTSTGDMRAVRIDSLYYVLSKGCSTQPLKLSAFMQHMKLLVRWTVTYFGLSSLFM